MKIKNQYARAISRKLYDDTPKAVFAALAVSYITNRDNVEFEDIDAAVRDEWATLYANGIVPQRPPRA